ncbi:MAG: type II toxin-antitoxin system RelE/ParE family toxin [Aestuariivirga sp.]
MEIREYEDRRDRSPFGQWFEDLDPVTAAKVTVALTRLENENVSNVKSVGSGVLELKIDFGPGYRIYFGKDGERIIILLGGGTKKRQQIDIAAAQDNWRSYKDRRKDKV